MSLMEVMDDRAVTTSGRRATAAEIQLLREQYPFPLPDWFLECLADYPLIGMELSLSKRQDLSGLGAQIRWMSPRSMIREARELLPGRTLCKLGFVPVGECRMGWGDPYFIVLGENDDPPLVRVYHRFFGDDGGIVDNCLDMVCENVSSLFAASCGCSECLRREFGN